MRFYYVFLLILGIVMTGFESISGDLQKKELNELLYKAFRNHNTKQMLAYMQAGADINAKSTALSLTLLEFAVAQDDTPMVKFLLTHGANAEIIGPNGRNLLSYARNRDIASLLLIHGASLTQNDDNGNTPMHWGGMYSAELIDFFLEHGGHINARNALGQTLLHRVCLRKPDSQNLKIITTLINKGTKLNIRDSAGATPLLYASMCDSEKRLKLLMDSGAQIDSVDKEGNSALHYAASAGAKKNITFLINHGLNIHIKNQRGETYLDLMNKNSPMSKTAPSSSVPQ